MVGLCDKKMALQACHGTLSEAVAETVWSTLVDPKAGEQTLSSHGITASRRINSRPLCRQVQGLFDRLDLFQLNSLSTSRPKALILVHHPQNIRFHVSVLATASTCLCSRSYPSFVA
jgi:hypothetical protein